jgi:hypothetical protein
MNRVLGLADITGMGPAASTASEVLKILSNEDWLGILC